MMRKNDFKLHKFSDPRLGHGVISNTRIPINTIVARYSGVYVDKIRRVSRSHDIIAPNGMVLRPTVRLPETTQVFNADDFAPYFQHAPDEWSELDPGLVTANLKLIWEYDEERDLPRAAFIAMRDIVSGEHLCWDYGEIQAHEKFVRITKKGDATDSRMHTTKKHLSLKAYLIHKLIEYADSNSNIIFDLSYLLSHSHEKVLGMLDFKDREFLQSMQPELHEVVGSLSLAHRKEYRASESALLLWNFEDSANTPRIDNHKLYSNVEDKLQMLKQPLKLTNDATPTAKLIAIRNRLNEHLPCELLAVAIKVIPEVNQVLKNEVMLRKHSITFLRKAGGQYEAEIQNKTLQEKLQAICFYQPNFSCSDGYSCPSVLLVSGLVMFGVFAAYHFSRTVDDLSDSTNLPSLDFPQ